MNQGDLPGLVLQSDCDQVIFQVTQLLASKGFLLIESFDLHSARGDQSRCPCPYHGTERCTCQLAVILVYADGYDPVTLTIHGNNQRTELAIVDSPGQHSNERVKVSIMAALGTWYLKLFVNAHQVVR